MLKKMTLLLILVTFLTGCGGILRSGENNAQGFAKATYWVEVKNHRGEDLDWKLQVTIDKDNRPSKPEEIQKLRSMVEEINAGIRRFNGTIEQVYAESGFVVAPTFHEIEIPEKVEDDGGYACGRGTWQNSYPDECLMFTGNTEEAGYKTTTRLHKDVAYVTVTSANGSKVSYAFPTNLLDMGFTYAFNDGLAPQMKSQFVVPAVKVDRPDASQYVEVLLKDLVADQNREAVAFTLNIDDYEGRQELKPVIVRALSLAAAQEGKPVTAVLHAMLASGQRAVATVSAEGTAIRLHGWWFLASGGLNSSGGDFKFSTTYSGWFEEVVRASIFVVPQ